MPGAAMCWHFSATEGRTMNRRAPAVPPAAAAWPCSRPGPAAPPRTLRFEQLSVQDGLPQESVLAIAQDRQGFIWFGTQGGLARYDGYRTVIYQHALSDPYSLSQNWVRVLHVDPAGRMWVGTDNGLDLFDPLAQRFTHYRPVEPEQRGNGNRHVRAIVDDGAGGLWIGTADGLQRFDPATGQLHDVAQHAGRCRAAWAHDQVNALARDSAGRLWIATPAGVDLLLPAPRRGALPSTTRWQAGRGGAVAAGRPRRTLWVGTHTGWSAGARARADGAARERLRRQHRADAGRHRDEHLPGSTTAPCGPACAMTACSAGSRNRGRFIRLPA
jgi:hypothetical protein